MAFPELFQKDIYHGKGGSMRIGIIARELQHPYPYKLSLPILYPPDK